MKEKVCVYDVVLKGEVVYVGMTKHPKIRKLQHRTTGVCSDGAELVVHKWYEDRKQAALAEKQRQYQLEPVLCKDLIIREKIVDDRPAFDWAAYREKLAELTAALTEDDLKRIDDRYNNRFNNS